MADIVRFARRLVGAPHQLTSPAARPAAQGSAVGRVDLEGAQFRCARSKEYVDWVEAVLRGEPQERARKLASAWQRVLDFRILDTPAALERALRQRLRRRPLAQ